MNAALRAAFAKAGDAPAMHAQDGQVVSYARFAQLVSGCTARLEALGVVPGQRVAPVSENLVVRVALILAVWRRGADAILTDAPSRPMGRGIKVDHVIADPGQVQVAGPAWHVFDESWMTPAEGAEPEDIDGGGLLFATSGSTGLPKYMWQSADIWYAQTLGFLQLSGKGHGASLVTYAPTTSAFLMAALMCFVTGHGMCLQRGTVEETLAAAKTFGAEILHAPPAVLQDIVTAAEQGAEGPAFGFIRAVGGATGPQLLARLHAQYGPVVTVVGGSNETLLFSMGDHDGSEVPAGWAGTVMPHVTYELRDPELYADLAPGAGRIAVKVPEQLRVQGYIGGGAIYDPEGWVETGDIVSVAPDGTLCFLGRDDFIISLGGNKFAPELIEALAETVPGVIQAGAAPIRGPEGDRLALLAVLEPGGDLEALRVRVAKRVVVADALVLAEAGEIPMLPSGKPDRPAIAERAQKG
ncbi:MAG: acyl--CoA ligase [Vannielia sp.]|uniref:AMP-binding protein n=1 Tax=Vannielia sp. TaxID=2813045 RepID=UPI003B8BE8F9